MSGYKERRRDSSLSIFRAGGCERVTPRMTLHERSGASFQSSAHELRLSTDARAKLEETAWRLITSAPDEVWLMVAHRTFENSEGVAFECFSQSWRARTQPEGAVADGGTIYGTSLSELRSLTAPMASGSHFVTEVSGERVAFAALSNPRAPIVAIGTAAAIAAHELIAHVAECGERCAGLQVAAPGVSVESIHPRLSGWDDEGVPIARTSLVREGRFTGEVRGRGSVGPSGRASGLAQASLHGARPLPRCTHLTMALGLRSTAMILAEMDEAIVVGDCAGGRSDNRHAVLSFDSGVLMRHGKAESVCGPFVAEFEIGRPSISEVSSAYEMSRSGVCLIDDSDWLMTQEHVPAIVLVGSQVYS